MTQAKVIDKGVEVYNVPGAGGTIGLSQLASKYSGKSNELMVMGLVMMGAIETNKSPTDLSKTTPIAALTTEPEAVFVRSDSKYKTMQDLVDDMKADPAKISVGGGSAGGTDQILLGLIAKAAGVDPSKPKYVAYSGGGEAQQSILSGSVDAGISAISEWADQVEAGKMRVLAVSTAEPIEVAGKQVKTLKDQGLDVEITNWRGVVAPPGHQDGRPRGRDRRDAEAARLAGVEADAREERVDRLLQDRRRLRLVPEDREHAGQGRPPGHRADRVRQSWAGPRLAGLFLLAASVAILIAVTAIPGRGGYGTAGPRFVPLIVAVGLIVLSALFLLRTWWRPDVELAQRSAEEDAATHWATPGLIMLALLVYAFALEPVGYPLATALVFFALARVLGSRAVVRDAVAGLVLGFGLFTAFTQYLGVSLPAGLTPIF